jgi:hypothetical protein
MKILDMLVGGSDLVKSVGDGLDKLFTSDEERLEKKNELLKAQREFDSLQLKLLAEQNIAQTEVNKIEAASASIFVAGWRPAIGWVGVLALTYQFLLYPILQWLPIDKAPPLPDANTLFTLITGMLGIAGLRSFDKLKETDTKSVGR